MASPYGDKSEYARLLLETDCLRDDLVRTIIDWLDLPLGSSGFDAGCGVGSNTLLLAEAVGRSGHVTGLDLADDLLRIAGERARQSGHEDRIDFKQGDINNPPFDPDTFDWVWSADCVGPGTGDIRAPLDEVRRNALGLLFDMRWGGAEGDADEQDWDLYRRLADPASPEFIGDRPGYYAFFTYTVFHGWRSAHAISDH